ncbi:MAG: BolA/IbaG family iron-sulfur metabolism protein [Gammaproteobacteria bacterium]|nr:BolA/IbaG family iron-sulfur metabolism protein [Gammaproteobacteria bacterium]
MEVESDGRHWFVTLISNDFRLLNRLQRHRKVYAILAQQLANEEIHALSLKTYTEEEWQSLKSTPST